MVSPHSNRQSSDRQRREHQPGVTEHWLTGEDRNDLGHDTEERKGQDINLRVTEEPEQVLPQNCATVSGVINVCTEFAVVQHAKGSCGQHREDQQNDDRRNQNVPGEDRQAEHRHTRGTQAHDRRDHVDSRRDGSDTTSTNADDPHVGTDTRRVKSVGQRRVNGPAEVSGSTRGKEARQH